MLSIDEAIAHAREVAEKQRKDNDNCEYKAEYGCKGCADYYSKTCIECAEEHEQLAEWLEELKDYRDKNKMVVRVDVENMDSIKDKIDELSKYAEIQYDKAIDDFVKMAYEELLYSEHLTKIDIDYIAEQLKEGGKNGKKKYIELS